MRANILLGVSFKMCLLLVVFLFACGNLSLPITLPWAFGISLTMSLFCWLILVVLVRLLFLDNAQGRVSGSSFTISTFKVLQHKYIATVEPIHTQEICGRMVLVEGPEPTCTALAGMVP